jgi:hypothetical protein
MIEYKNKAQARKDSGVSYLGSVNMTTKHKKNYKYNELNYSLYLSPGNTSGYEVCPGSTVECRTLCLHESGVNRINTQNVINKSRIAKTKLFFENREFLTRWMIAEILSAKTKAKILGYSFSVRLNNTSDINPIQFYIHDGGVTKNILEIFPDVMFYDYSKVKSRIRLTKIYKNYDLTFSFNGYNMYDCRVMLENGIRVAMVFKKVPETFEGYKVIDGDINDLRYRDKEPVIVGLKYKNVRNKLTPDVKFVIQ